jgi:uncharacterized glyoxalase superfamily protein PhnB
MSPAHTEIIPYIFYRDVPAALAWLARAFGFVEEMRTGTPGGGMHAQMRLDGCRIMLGQLAAPAPAVPPPADATAVFVYLPDVDAHYRQALAAGADAVAPHDVDYGRTYSARDPDGHIWYFTTPPG